MKNVKIKTVAIATLLAMSVIATTGCYYDRRNDRDYYGRRYDRNDRYDDRRNDDRRNNDRWDGDRWDRNRDDWRQEHDRD